MADVPINLDDYSADDIWALSVTEIRPEHVELIVNYWQNADPAFLLGMGVDLKKMPPREQLTEMIADQLHHSYEQKKAYALIWLVDDQPVGHCNVNKIIYGEEAYMHLHLWDSNNRQKRMGALFVQITIPYFFRNLKLKSLYCEPYALNPAPNKTLEKIGFELVKEYVTIPGYLNFEQPVKLWQLTFDKYQTLY